ncbi:phage DNA ejection protein [Yersinia bercovieri]|uniref:phage DNA ejection protein n=1 Tax=Yersinia bercovieri TaxID=634 RepID=UPI0011A660D2|nr:phage DNA ejection protein [Yersinia bercovieri]
MATWEQGNSGGLLAGIGTNNSNAPQGSDVNAALSLIRDNNEFTRSGGNNIGLQSLQGLAGLKQQYQQDQQQQRQKEFQQAYAGAYSSGDRNAMRQLAAQYPDQFEAVRNGMGFIDEDQRNTIGSLASTARLAAQSPETMGEWLKSSAGDLARVGVNPADVATMYQQNQQGFGEFADHLVLSALGPEKYFDLQDKAAGRQIDQAKLAETVRSNQAGEAVQWANNGIAQQNVNLRKLELDDKKYDRQISNETNALKLADLQDKRQQNQQSIEQAKRDKADAYYSGIDNMSRTIDTATKVLKSPGFTGYFGTNLNPLSSRYIPGTDAADTEALVDTLKSQGFMSGIQQMKGMGALSNAEGQKVMDAIGNLSSGQSEKSARAAIKTIISTTENAQKRMQQKYGKDIPVQQQNPTQEQQAGSSPVVNQQPAAQQPAGGSYTSKSGIQFTVK